MILYGYGECFVCKKGHKYALISNIQAIKISPRPYAHAEGQKASLWSMPFQILYFQMLLKLYEAVDVNELQQKY